MSVNSSQHFDPAEHHQASMEVIRGTGAQFVVWGFGAISVVLLVLNVISNWGDGSSSFVLAQALPYLLLAGFWLIFIPFSQRRAAGKVPEMDASVRGLHTRTVDAIGFHFRGNDVGLDVPWHAMHRVRETEQFFLFYYNKKCAYYLPKRALAPEEIVEVRALIRDGVDGRAQLQTA